MEHALSTRRRPGAPTSALVLAGALQRPGVTLEDDQGCDWLEDLVVAGGNGTWSIGGISYPDAGRPGGNARVAAMARQVSLTGHFMVLVAGAS